MENGSSHNESLHERLRELRVEHGKDQREIAERLGISQPQYSKMESGIHDLSINRLLLLCDFYEISPNDFLVYTQKGEGREIK